MIDSTPATELPADKHYCLAEVDLFRDLSRRGTAALGTLAPQHTVSAGQVVHSPLQPTTSPRTGAASSKLVLVLFGRR